MITDELKAAIENIDLCMLPGFDIYNDNNWCGKLDFDEVKLRDETAISVTGLEVNFSVTDNKIVDIEILGFKYCELFDLKTTEIIKVYENI